MGMGDRGVGAVSEESPARVDDRARTSNSRPIARKSRYREGRQGQRGERGERVEQHDRDRTDEHQENAQDAAEREHPGDADAEQPDADAEEAQGRPAESEDVEQIHDRALRRGRHGSGGEVLRGLRQRAEPEGGFGEPPCAADDPERGRHGCPQDLRREAGGRGDEHDRGGGEHSPREGLQRPAQSELPSLAGRQELGSVGCGEEEDEERLGKEREAGDERGPAGRAQQAPVEGVGVHAASVRRIRADPHRRFRLFRAESEISRRRAVPRSAGDAGARNA